MAYQQPPGYSQQPPGYSQYPPQPQPGYQPAPGYMPAQGYPPAPVAQQQHSSNVVVVQQPSQGTVHTTTVIRDERPNHLLHCIITFFCPWWIFIWLIVCCVYGC